MIRDRHSVSRSLRALALAAVLSAAGMAGLSAQAEPPSEPPADWGPTALTYENVPYPHPVEFLEVNLYGQDLRMAYMEVTPVGPANGQTVVLFHGMNFFAAAFRSLELHHLFEMFASDADAVRHFGGDATPA